MCARASFRLPLTTARTIPEPTPRHTPSPPQTPPSTTRGPTRPTQPNPASDQPATPKQHRRTLQAEPPQSHRKQRSPRPLFNTPRHRQPASALHLYSTRYPPGESSSRARTTSARTQHPPQEGPSLPHTDRTSTRTARDEQSANATSLPCIPTGAPRTFGTVAARSKPFSAITTVAPGLKPRWTRLNPVADSSAQLRPIAPRSAQLERVDTTSAQRAATETANATP
jgi:hypothetical protein